MRHDYQLVQLLQRLAIVSQLRGQPVEQFGVRRQRPHPTEVVGRIDNAAAEVILPDAVGDAPPGERIGWIAEPFGEGSPASAIIIVLSRDQTWSRFSGSKFASG